jgi:hypothetical protein
MSTISRIAIIRNGAIANVILADLATWTPPAGIVAMTEAEALALGYARESAQDDRKIWPNAAAFLGEFSMSELAAIELSANPIIAALRLVLAAWTADVWSDDERIQMGMDALVDAGILAQERADSILGQDIPA